LLAFTLLVGCQRYDSIELPKSRAAFAGTWSAEGNFLRLSPSGDVELELETAQSSILIRGGRLRRFTGTTIEFGVGNCQPSERLTISEAPYSTPNGEAIRLAGVELYRSTEPSED
jgi:hypothetical protein